MRLAIGLLAALTVIAQSPAQSPAPTTAPKPDEPGLYAIFNTSMGIIRARLFEREALNTVRTFVSLVQGTRPWADPATKRYVAKPFYNNLLFHRVIPFFMVQTGSANGTTAYDCGFTIPDEFNPALKFDQPGRLAMANTGTPNSGGCQIFITETANAGMNGKYTIFGQVVDGQDVVKSLSRVVVDSDDKPRFPIRLRNVLLQRVAAAPPTPTP
jgi:peptidyl-prolyl cis-trans isomerase A (cyclophilin A)